MNWCVSTGPERIIIDSACDWGVSNSLAVPKTARLMIERDIPAETIRMVTYDNALAVYGLDGEMKAVDWLEPMAIDQRTLYSGNSVLRGGQTPVITQPGVGAQIVRDHMTNMRPFQVASILTALRSAGWRGRLGLPDLRRAQRAVGQPLHEKRLHLRPWRGRAEQSAASRLVVVALDDVSRLQQIPRISAALRRQAAGRVEGGSGLRDLPRRDILRQHL